ncbi:alpha/beta hydrolase family protein, partial [Methylomagnum sp.]
MRFPRKGFLPALLMLFVCAAATAARLDPARYDFPYPDPYLATTTVALLKDRDKRLVDDDSRCLHIQMIPGRNDIELLEGKGRLRVRFQPQDDRHAPLIFLIPGFGGSAYTGSTRYVAQMLVDRGFQVATLPSPFSWNFALAASQSGFPGYTGRDSEDLYAAMQAVLQRLRERDGVSVSRIGLIGFSHGALHAGYLSKLDAERKQIGFDKVLLVNPPVNLPEAIRKIDQLADLDKRFSTEERDDIESYAFGVGRAALNRDIDDPGYFADWNRRLRLSGEQIRYLIGKALRVPVGNMLYVIELMKQPGILTTPVSWGYRSARFEEARSYDILDYVRQILAPRLRQDQERNADFERLAAESSLTAIGPSLRSNPRVHLMHNADDFLISAEDLRFAEDVFGARARIYPHGGHLGNLWFPQNRRDLLGLFEPLLAGKSGGGG